MLDMPQVARIHLRRQLPSVSPAAASHDSDFPAANHTSLIPRPIDASYTICPPTSDPRPNGQAPMIAPRTDHCRHQPVNARRAKRRGQEPSPVRVIAAQGLRNRQTSAEVRLLPGHTEELCMVNGHADHRHDLPPGTSPQRRTRPADIRPGHPQLQEGGSVADLRTNSTARARSSALNRYDPDPLTCPHTLASTTAGNPCSPALTRTNTGPSGVSRAAPYAAGDRQPGMAASNRRRAAVIASIVSQRPVTGSSSVPVAAPTTSFRAIPGFGRPHARRLGLDHDYRAPHARWPAASPALPRC